MEIHGVAGILSACCTDRPEYLMTAGIWRRPVLAQRPPCMPALVYERCGTECRVGAGNRSTGRVGKGTYRIIYLTTSHDEIDKAVALAKYRDWTSQIVNLLMAKLIVEVCVGSHNFFIVVCVVERATCEVREWFAHPIREQRR